MENTYYVFISLHICIHISLHICIHICIHICNVYTDMFILFIYIHVYLYVYVYGCMYTCMYAQIRRLSESMRQAFVNDLGFMELDEYQLTVSRIDNFGTKNDGTVCTNTSRAQSYSYMHTYIHTCIHTCIRMCMRAYICVCISLYPPSLLCSLLVFFLRDRLALLGQHAADGSGSSFQHGLQRLARLPPITEVARMVLHRVAQPTEVSISPFSTAYDLRPSLQARGIDTCRVTG